MKCDVINLRSGLILKVLDKAQFHESKVGKWGKDTSNDARGKFQNENYFKFDGWKTIIGERRGG